MEEKEIYRFRVDLKYALKRVIDPEMSVDVYELGLIRRMDIVDDQDIEIDMILTSPACPVADELVEQVKKEVNTVKGVREVTVNLLTDPWDQSMLREEARLALGIYDW